MSVVPFSQIHLRLDTFLDSIRKGYPIVWPLEKSTPPDTIHIRPICRTGTMTGGEKGEFGRSQRTGVYFVDVIAPNPTDEQEALELAEHIELKFRRNCVENIYIQGDPYTENRGIDEFNAFMARVTVPFWAWAAK